MPDVDISIGSVGVPTTVAVPKKPSYLIFLEDATPKNKRTKKFITLDKPEFVSGFVQVKGFFTDLPEDEVIKTFPEVLTSVAKDLILEVFIPWQRITYMRSLVFKQK